MTLRIKLSHLVVGLVVGALLVGAGYALATTRTRVVHACVNAKTRALTVPASGRCGRGTRALNWNQQGPRGATGAKGGTGAAGTSATVSIGSVTTEAAGSQATVSNSGSGSNAVLNFGIPQGAPGANAPGTGATAYGQVWMGSGINSGQLAPGANSSNVLRVSGGAGSAVITVTGCTSAGRAEPVINVTADADPSDTLSGSNSATIAGAYVTGWSASGSDLGINVSTYNAANGLSAISDFSFSVYC